MRKRRGNTIVLVVGVLVLLAIIATSYVTRTHAARLTSISQQQMTTRDDNAHVIGGLLADEIALALFPRPIDRTDPWLVMPGRTADSNYPRLSPLRNPVRYGVDQDVLDNSTRIPVPGGDGIPDFPYNFAPYQTVPFTNWPDPVGAADPWPRNAAGFGTDLLTLLGVGEGNPPGNPGMGDARWLCDTEPLRWDSDGDGTDDSFLNWRHMSNIARPDNAWRVCVDISDVYADVDGDGVPERPYVVTDLGIPVEQWLPIAPANKVTGPEPLQGDTFFVDPDTFMDQWKGWFGWSGAGYAQRYTNPAGMPANLYCLRDLDADGYFHGLGERPQDEYVPGTKRHTVSRVLADADGDGFTDSFWFLAPSTNDRGIRQIVALRIIDNSAMLDVNAATRFQRSDPAPDVAMRTVGAMPADLALVGQLRDYPLYPHIDSARPEANWNVGFYDYPDQWYEIMPWPNGSVVHYGAVNQSIGGGGLAGSAAISLWSRHLDEVGLLPFLTGVDMTQAQRLDYWRRGVLDPLRPDPGSPYTPFGIPSEIELRLFHGNNYPWLFSRLEHTTHHNLTIYGFLHGQNGRVESSEYGDQLGNRYLMRDPRRKLTVYSGARNDVMPPWLWAPDPTVSRLKWDLRGEPVDLNGDTMIYGDFDGDAADLELDPRDAAIRETRLRDLLERALIDDAGRSYYGADLDKTRRLAAGFAANIDAYQSRELDLTPGNQLARGLEDEPYIEEAVPVSNDPDRKFLGMERQPFLVEAVVGHVYKGVQVPLSPARSNSGEYVVLNHPITPHSSVVAVQLANPYYEPLPLDDYVLRVFHDPATAPNEVSLAPGGSIGPDGSMVFYSVDPAVVASVPFLADLGVAGGVPVALATDRSHYDSSTAPAIELVRLVPSASGGTVPIVVDRIDIPNGSAAGADDAFAQAVDDLESTRPPDYVLPPPAPAPFPGLPIGSDTHWFQWARGVRQWDRPTSGFIVRDNERNPRYVFADRWVEADEDAFGGATALGVGARFAYRDKKCTGCAESLEFPMQMLQKDRDFDQVGELLNVWLFGHELDAADQTVTTFSEFMLDEVRGLAASDQVGVNRLRAAPTAIGGQTAGTVIGGAPPGAGVLDPGHAHPALPAAARVLDAFVCDGGGWLDDANDDGVLNAADAAARDQRRYRNAAGFSGAITPGLLNLNTLTYETLRAAPHMTRLVREDLGPRFNPYVRASEAIVRYRERLGSPPGDFRPDYADRNAGVRPERGFASIGEALLVNRPATYPPPPPPPPVALEVNDGWRMSFGARFGFPDTLGNPHSARLSTDVNHDIDRPLAGSVIRDEVAGDSEEANLLFAGISNVITTRSDVFTVYFRVRSFRQDPVTGRWDATNRENIVNESRYVMLVDRSEVNRPTDGPKIVYMEKVPR